MSEPQQRGAERSSARSRSSRLHGPEVSDEEIRARIEAALYSSGRALDAEQLAKAAGISSKKRAIDEAKAIQSRMKSIAVRDRGGGVPGAEVRDAAQGRVHPRREEVRDQAAALKGRAAHALVHRVLPAHLERRPRR